MERIELRIGSFELIAESESNQLPTQFANILEAVLNKFPEAVLHPKEAAKVERKEKSESPADTDKKKFSEFLSGFKPPSPSEEILAFAIWFDDDFKKADYINAINDAGIYNDTKKNNFFGLVTNLCTTKKVLKVTKGVYRIQQFGKEFVNKKKMK